MVFARSGNGKWIEADCLSSHMWFFSHHTRINISSLAKEQRWVLIENYRTGSSIDLRRRVCDLDGAETVGR